MDERKDYDRAEDFFKKAIKLEPRNPKNLGAYAFFLMDIRKDYNQAMDFCKKAVEAGTKNAHDFSNYAKLLIGKGNLDEARKMIKGAFENNKEDKNLELELELWFYCYAVFYQEFPESATAIETLLKQGVRSEGWYFKDMLEVAKKRGHPDYSKLCQYESRIIGTAK